MSDEQAQPGLPATPAASAEDEAAVGADLERLTPAADAGWSARLGDELQRETARRGVRARPPHLWLRAGALVALGLALLALALAQV